MWRSRGRDSAAVDALDEVGIAAKTGLSKFRRAGSLLGAVKTAERKLADGTLRHGGQGLMAWAVGKARVELKGNAILVTKQASGSAKVDPLMAVFNPIALMAIIPWAAQPSIT